MRALQWTAMLALSAALLAAAFWLATRDRGSTTAPALAPEERRGRGARLADVYLVAGSPAAAGGTMQLRLLIIPKRRANQAEIVFALSRGLVPVAGATQRFIDLDPAQPTALDLSVLLLETGDQSVAAGLIVSRGARGDRVQFSDFDQLLLRVSPSGTEVLSPRAPEQEEQAELASLLLGLPPLQPPRSQPLLRCGGSSLRALAGGGPGVAVRCAVSGAPAGQRSVRLSAWVLGDGEVIARVDPLCSALLDHGSGACSRDLTLLPSTAAGMVVAGMLRPSGELFGPAPVLGEIEL